MDLERDKDARRGRHQAKSQVPGEHEPRMRTRSMPYRHSEGGKMLTEEANDLAKQELSLISPISIPPGKHLPIDNAYSNTPRSRPARWTCNLESFNVQEG